MKRFIAFILAISFTGITYFTYLNFRVNTVIAVHQTGNIAVILIDHLPPTESARMKWWIANRESIDTKYHIMTDDPKGMLSYFIYEYGDGYMKEGKEDRLCLDDVPPPNNCVDKNILLHTWRGPEGATLFSFPNSTYIANRDGSISRVNDTVKIVEPDEK